MKPRFSRRPSPSMVVALVALFVALGGTSFAALVITGGNVRNGSLTGADVKNASLTGTDVRNNKLTGRDVTSLSGGDVKNGTLTGNDVRDDSLKGEDIVESTLGKVPTAAAADSATTATDASTLNGKTAAQLSTASGSDTRSASLALTTSNQTVLSATITLPAPAVVTAIASIELRADGGNNDNANCNTNIDGVVGARQSTEIAQSTIDKVETLPLTQQSATLGTGPHTVTVVCNTGVGSATSASDRTLSVISTG